MSSNTNTNTQQWNNSIFIPTLYKSISKNELFEYMEDNFGKVERIDFVDLNENSRRVFLHFSEWYSNKGYAQMARYQMEKFGFSNIYIPNKKNNKNPIFDAKIFINKNPLSPLEFKVKQLKYRLNLSFNRNHNIEKKVEDLENIIESLNEKIADLMDKNNNHHPDNNNIQYNDNDNNSDNGVEVCNLSFTNDRCLLISRSDNDRWNYSRW